MKFSKDITINASAEKVWDILAHQFVDVGVWARSVPKSEVNHTPPKVNGSPVGGRLCDTSIGHISEEFTAYDEEGMTFSFKGVITSKMFTSVISTNAVTSIDEKTSKVTVTPAIDLTFLGKLMSPMIRMNLNKTINGVLDDLKYFAENDKPSPEKLKAQK